MNDRPPGRRVLVMALLLVLAVRLLAWTASADSLSSQPALNQTVPTRTPTPPPWTPVPSATRQAVSTPTERSPAPRPTEGIPLLTPERTPAATSTTASPEPVGTGVPTTEQATGLPGGTALATTTSLVPDSGPAAPVEPPPTVSATTVRPATTGQAGAALPQWTPAVAAGVTAGGASCLWPVVGLLIAAAGVGLLLKRPSRRQGKEGH